MLCTKGTLVLCSGVQEMPAEEWTDTQIRRNAKQQPLLMKEVYLPRLVATKATIFLFPHSKLEWMLTCY